MANKFVYTSLGITSLLLGVFITWTMLSSPTVINKDIIDAHNSTCGIVKKAGKEEYVNGTGVLLNTGYIITAAHVVDHNLNRKLDKKERKIKIRLYERYGIPYEYECDVVYFNRGLDFALLKPLEAISSKTRFSIDRPNIGDRLITIGHPKGGPLNITEGFESVSDKTLHGKASLSAYFGNSGGGIFNKNQEVVGILTNIATDRRTSWVVIFEQTKRGFKIMRAPVHYYQTIPHMTMYTRSTSIYNHLEEKNIGFTVIKPEEPFDYGLWLIYLKMTLQIAGVIACAWFFRRQILG